MTIHKQDIIKELILRALSGEDISHRKELKNLSYREISIYAVEHDLKFTYEDIGRDQKASLIQSIVKRNT